MELPTLIIVSRQVDECWRQGSRGADVRAKRPSTVRELREAPHMRAQAWSGATLDQLAGRDVNDGLETEWIARPYFRRRHSLVEWAFVKDSKMSARATNLL